jgi:hypothetical protein
VDLLFEPGITAPYAVWRQSRPFRCCDHSGSIRSRSACRLYVHSAMPTRLRDSGARNRAPV